MSAVRNVLFIMCDQLRADYLGCAGHPTLRTPNIDALARRGVRFEHAYVQSPVCGPSRMSFYTGRYVSSHGATWNRVPLGAEEWTIGDYLRDSAMTVALAGKTHVMPDEEGLARLGIEGGTALGAFLRGGGFRELDRYDGHHAPGKESGYPDFLRAHGYDSADPWSDYVISVQAPDGQVLSGWNMRNVGHPARVKAEHSETAYMTDQAIGFIEAQGEQPWFLHLSYVKPHWPYVAPAPYHALYGSGDVTAPVRDKRELVQPHPVVAAYRQHEELVNFARDETIARVKPAYMGLIAQLDAELGRLFATLERNGRWADTLVIFTADHGDFLGDHWLGEKELFYEQAVRVPLIVANPDPSCDSTRGRVDAHLVEAIDVLPTCLDTLRRPAPSHRLEGRSLLPLLRGEAVAWRDCVFSELDYSFRQARELLGREPQECRAYMMRDERWKYIHWQGLAPQLFDLQADPNEFVDLGRDPAYEAERRRLRERLLEWLLARKLRVTASDDWVRARTNTHRKHGIHYGVW